MKRLGIAGVTLFLSHAASAVTVAVIDSGLDTNHQKLTQNIWSNAADLPANSVDEDSNGFPDDVNGWNFAENNNLLLDPRFSRGFPEDCYEFFRKQGRLAAGIGTDEDKKWVISKQKNPLFVAELMRFGNYVHGTHVAGVATGLSPVSKAIGIKIIPTAQSTTTLSQELAKAMAEIPAIHEDQEGIRDTVIRFVIRKVADGQSKTIAKAIDYAQGHRAQVANGSFGVSRMAIEPVLKGFLSLFGKNNPEDVKTYANYLIEQMNLRASEALNKTTDMVFVFAAGNDGKNNDDSPVSPAGVKSDRVITVAATNGLSSLASFSNYGLSVDVAAPGVNIVSTVPGNRQLEMSGTSMAAPYVSHIVAMVREVNPDLTPAEVKQIIVGTVDQKGFLKGKVASNGIVNLERATQAAAYSKGQSVDLAIENAHMQVKDQVGPEEKTVLESYDHFVLPLPSPVAL